MSAVLFYMSTKELRWYRGVEQLVAPRAHNPEVGGSSPPSATKSVTVVDTMSTTVIFYFPPPEGWFLRKAGLFPNISGHRRNVRPNLLRPWWENPRLSKTAIVIRVETINYYFPYRNPPKAAMLRCAFGGFSLITVGQKRQKGQLKCGQTINL